MDDLLKQLSPERRALLARRLAKKPKDDTQNHKIPQLPRSGKGDAFPVSFAQQRLWFLYQLDPDNPYYNVYFAVRLKGPLKVAVLEQSLNEIVRRHESLRTTFATIDGQSMQIIAPALVVPLPIIDLRAYQPDEQAAEMTRLTNDEIRRPFDLEHGPILRGSLLRLAAEDHLLVMVKHHIIADGWSTGVFIREVVALYEAFSNRRPSPLPELPIQYADFAQWQQQRLHEIRDNQLSYWRKQLAGLPTLELPTDYPRPAVQSFRGTYQSFSLPRNLSLMLRALSQREQVTMFMTLLAGFQVLLYRYTGQDDIVVGTDVANRSRPEVELLIGFFVNQLVLRVDLSGNPTFRDLLQRVRKVTLDAYAHQDLPFEQLVEALQPERDLSRTPLFQVMFVVENTPQQHIQLPGLSVSHFDLDAGASKLDLSLLMKDTPDGVVGMIEYNTDLFTAGTIARLLGHLQAVLEGIVADPEQRIGDLPLLTSAEREQLVVAWNQTTTSFPLDLCFHQIFEAQVERTPDAVAVLCGQEQLTYHELNTRANRLASILIKHGVGPDAVVALLAERGAALLTAILAVFKAGGAYLPLDPGYTAARITQVLHQSRTRLVLSADQFRPVLSQALDMLAAETQPQILPIANLLAEPGVEPNLPARCIPTNLAYVIYTSGSTGVPKGAMIEHHGMVNHLYAKVKDLQLSAADTVAQTASQAFDISVWQLLVPLVVGGRVEIVPDQIAHEPARLLAHLQGGTITILEIVPSLFGTLLEEIARCEQGPPALTKLRWLLSTGEALPVHLARAWFRRYPRIRLLNAYGPTECSDDVTHYVMQEALPDTISTVPIGRAVANMQLYVLDRALKPLPVGVPGELYVGGVGVGRGYLNDPRRTAEAFIADPFSATGQRLYKTGDLVRRLASGDIEYLGRIDHQVKLRGFRIELGEIEAVLAQHPNVRSVIVVAHADVSGEKRLVAYVVPRQEHTLQTDELRQFLQARLPAYMVPAAFMALEEMPLTTNGKIDRKTLPLPDWSQDSSERVLVAPRTPVEEVLAGIWADILRLDRLGMDDNFFALGGHSLLATQVVSRVRDAFRVDLPLRTLFEAPTLSSFARRIEAARCPNQELRELPLVAVAHDGLLPLSFAQQRLWFLDQFEPDSSFYNIFAAVQLKGQLKVEALQHSLSEVVRRHEALRTIFPTIDGQPHQVIMPAAAVPLTPVELQHLPADQRMSAVRQLATTEARQPFDLAQGPLLRAGLVRVAEDQHVLLLTMHHIVFDGWSLGILIREVAALYEAFDAGQSHLAGSGLPDLPIQYVDFAHWQRQMLQAEVGAIQLDYWRQQLDGAAVLQLPTDRPRPAVQTFRGASQSFALSAALAEQLAQLSRREEATLFITLLSVFKVLLYRYSGQQDIVVGTPIANRTRSELEPLIGLFVNTLVLRSNLSANPSFRQLLRRVREVALAAYAHQDLPFEQLVKELQPSRDLSQQALFQVMFVLERAPVERVELPGLSLSRMEVETGTVQFDLTLSMEETDAALLGRVEYNTDLFDDTTIQRMIQHFQQLLSAIVAKPEQPIANVPILTDTEQRLLVEWNQTQTPYPHDQCLHQLFEAQVERTPDAVAVILGADSLTFAELNRRANQLAHHLRDLGAGPELRIGLCVERSLEMVVGMVGILKAGAAFVTLDPGYPAERLAFMAADAQVTMLLTLRQLQGVLPKLDVPTIYLDGDQSQIDRARTDNPETGVLSTNLAYMTYTSGSTGRPKGVLTPHQAVCNHLWWMQSNFPLSTLDRVLQVAALSFEVTVCEVFIPLISGAAVVLIQPGGQHDGAYLVQTIAEQQVTTLNVVPALLGMLLEEPEIKRCTSLRHIFNGGEALPVALTERLFSKLDVQLHNVYGPTETTIDSTCWNTDRRHFQHTIVIGRPIANTQVYVLNHQLQPTPIGVPGEIYLGGVGVARGYHNRPELTAEKFVPDPFATAPGARLYRTGDLARWLPDGNLEFLGRLDYQVKVRGHRIELDEVAAGLQQHPAVQDAVAVTFPDQPGSARLVAYVVPSTGTALTVAELRGFLAQRLPEYMIPSAFVVLERLPLTPNGKIDRKALPLPERSRTTGDEAIVAPGTPTETILAEIWQQVLGLERVSIHDNFFELGGDSILTIQIIARARNAGLRLSAKQIFQHQTIAALSAVASSAPALQAEQGLVVGDVPLTPIQHWFFEQNLQDPHHYNQAVMLEARQRLAPALLAQVVQSLVAHHDALRMRFAYDERGRQQVNAGLDDQTPFTEIDLSPLTDAEQEAALQAAAGNLQASLDLSAGPLLRIALVERGADRRQRLLVVIHHLVVDGVSWRILLDDLQTAYQQLSRHQPIQLPPKTTAFRHWAQRLVATAPGLDSELAYWQSILAGENGPLPVDAAGVNTVASARTFSATLSVEETRALLQEVPAAYRTQINEVLLTALAQTLTGWSGQQAVLVDVEGHGREELFADVDLSRTVGWFTSIFPVRLPAVGNNPPEHALKLLKEQLRAIPQRGIGYGMLRYLSLDPQLRELPQAELNFNYLGQLDHAVSESGLLAAIDKPIGALESPRNQRSYLLEVNGSVREGQLRLDWTYSTNIHRTATIEHLAARYLDHLRTLIAGSRTGEHHGYVPSDFGKAQLTQQKLDKLIAKLSKNKGRSQG